MPQSVYIMQRIIEQAFVNYNVVEVALVIDGCRIELTPGTIAKAMKVPIKAEETH